MTANPSARRATESSAACKASSPTSTIRSALDGDGPTTRGRGAAPTSASQRMRREERRGIRSAKPRRSAGRHGPPCCYPTLEGVARWRMKEPFNGRRNAPRLVLRTYGRARAAPSSAQQGDTRGRRTWDLASSTVTAPNRPFWGRVALVRTASQSLVEAR